MRIGIAIATTGRPDVLAQTLSRLTRQTRKPDCLLVAGAAPGDAPPGPLPAGAEFILSPKGSAIQRNYALEALRNRVDIIAFIDDDYVAARDFVERIAVLMSEHPEITAASGHLLADGAHSAGVSFEQADQLIAAHESRPADTPYIIDDSGTYGCNMVMRLSAAPLARFDENLPLYAWLEDTDYSAHFARAGRVVRTSYFAGVHLGTKTGRSPGVHIGYSQIANPLYLAKKGTLNRKVAMRMAVKNIAANTIKSLRPESWIDRAGRLRGNLLALADIALGKSHPRRVLEL